MTPGALIPAAILLASLVLFQAGQTSSQQQLVIEPNNNNSTVFYGLHTQHNHTRVKRNFIKAFADARKGADAHINKLVAYLDRHTESDRIREQADKVTELYRGTVAEKPHDFHVMVYRLSNKYKPDLRETIVFKTVNVGGSLYGVWVFMCGHFTTESARGYDNWHYGGPCWHKTNGGNTVHFGHPGCPIEDLRQCD